MRGDCFPIKVPPWHFDRKAGFSTKLAKFSRLAAAVALLGSLAGCAWVSEHREPLQKTATIVAARAGKIALNCVIGAARDYAQAGRDADFIDGLASGVRTLDWEAQITGGDIEALVAAWTPRDSRYDEAGKRFGALWDAHAPRTRAETAIFLEAMATGLNTEAYRARIAADLQNLASGTQAAADLAGGNRRAEATDGTDKTDAKGGGK